MRMRHARRPLVAVGLISVLMMCVGVATTVPTQANAAVHKKHPKKHHHKKGASGAAKKLKKLEADVAKEKGATFQVVYKTTYSGHSQTITFAQAPPKLLIKATSGSLIDTGTETLFCAPGTCVSAGATDPLLSLEDLFSPTTAESFFSEAEAAAAAKRAGYTMKFSTATFAGLRAECAAVNGNGVSGKYCVADNGLLAYAGASSGSVQLESYSGTVPGGAFTPPSGVTIVTEPST
jgi:hypothetical protein